MIRLLFNDFKRRKPTTLQIMTTFEIAQALGQLKGRHSIACSEKGYFSEAGTRISKDRALAVLTELQKADTLGVVACSTGITFDKLNAATQAFFFQLCEQIQSATQDAGMLLGAKIGKDIPTIGLQNAPRLSNLKKAGMFKTDCAKGWVILTPLGRNTFLATI